MEDKKTGTLDNSYVRTRELLIFIQELKDIYFTHPDILCNLNRINRFVLDNREEIEIPDRAKQADSVDLQSVPKK